MTWIAARMRAMALLLGVILALSSLAVGCGQRITTAEPSGTPAPSTAARPDLFVLEAFESGDLADWRVVDSGAGGWFVYTDGAFSPDPVHAAIMAEHRVPDPPEGTHAATTDTGGPGAHIIYRDFRPSGPLTLQLTAFYVSANPLASPATFAHDRPEPNQQFRIDIIRPTAPIDTLAADDLLATAFQTASGGSLSVGPTDVNVDLSPWSGEALRLRIAKADNLGPLRVGVDAIRFLPAGPGADTAIELLDTPAATSAVDLLLRRLSEADALAALSLAGAERAGADISSGAVLVARDGHVLLDEAWGQADRAAGVANTTETRFRLASMNKMFTAVATLQLVESGNLELDRPFGAHLPDYPNEPIASTVTVRHLLSHTGGTGDIFGPQFDSHRLELREHGDYLELYGSRGPRFEPGSRYEYSNYGYVLLGAIIEAVTGSSYHDYVEEHIFAPLGMRATGSLPESADVPDRAIGYTRTSPELEWRPNTDTLPWRGTAAGGGYSTVGDLLHFADGLRSGALISEDTLAEATRAQSVEPYGLGFELRGEGSLRSYGHGGSAPGMNGDLRVFPELGYVVVALSNLDPPAASDLVEYFVLRMPED